MEPVILLFLLFSPVWWLVIVGASVLIMLASEKQSPGWATTAFLVAVGVLVLFSDTPLVALTLSNPKYAVAFVLCYLTIGTGWGIAHWYWYCLERLDAYNDTKRKWLESRGVSEMNADLKSKWAEFVKTENRYKKFKPEAWQCKGMIMGWMAFWPWDMTWFFIDDFVRGIFVRIYNAIAQTLDSIAARVFKDYHDDIEK